MLQSGPKNHNLIGVANIFLDVLFHPVRLDHQTPIISQHGEVAGRLRVEIEKTSGELAAGSGGEAAQPDGKFQQGPVWYINNSYQQKLNNLALQ